MRIAFHRAALIAGLTLAGAGASDAAAQSDRHALQCRKAAKIVERGKPDRKEAWAWSTVLGCGAEGGLAARDAWRRTRSETDTAKLEELYGRLWSLRDAALFEAARSITADPSASAPGRVYGAMMLVSQLLDGADPTYAWFTSVGPRGVCRIASVSDKAIHPGAPLPADARQRARLVGQQLASDAGAPSIVRSAGRCLAQALRIDDEIRASGAIRHDADCRLARQTLETGHPAPKMAWARRLIVGCGSDAPAALAADMRRLRTSSDTVAAHALMRGAMYIRDAAFFGEALATAQSTQATQTARVTGFLVAAMELTDNVGFHLGDILVPATERPNNVAYRVGDNMVSTVESPCQLIFSSTSLRVSAGTALPPGAAAQLRAAAAAVLQDRGASLPLANAARCAAAVTELPSVARQP